MCFKVYFDKAVYVRVFPAQFSAYTYSLEGTVYKEKKGLEQVRIVLGARTVLGVGKAAHH